MVLSYCNKFVLLTTALFVIRMKTKIKNMAENRFATVTEGDIANVINDRDAKSTKKQIVVYSTYNNGSQSII